MKFCLTVFVLLIAFSVMAQDQSEDNQVGTQSESESQTANTRPIEEIEVTAQKSFYTLRLQIENAEDNVFSTFNELNIDDDFDVDCRESDFTHTRIQRRICNPVFFDNAIYRNTQDTLKGIDIHLSESDIRLIEQENFVKLESMMLEIAQEHDSFARELLVLWNLEEEFKTRREECMKTPAVLFLFRKC